MAPPRKESDILIRERDRGRDRHRANRYDRPRVRERIRDLRTSPLRRGRAETSHTKKSDTRRRTRSRSPRRKSGDASDIRSGLHEFDTLDDDLHNAQILVEKLQNRKKKLELQEKQNKQLESLAQAVQSDPNFLPRILKESQKLLNDTASSSVAATSSSDPMGAIQDKTLDDGSHDKVAGTTTKKMPTDTTTQLSSDVSDGSQLPSSTGLAETPVNVMTSSPPIMPPPPLPIPPTPPTIGSNISLPAPPSILPPTLTAPPSIASGKKDTANGFNIVNELATHPQWIAPSQRAQLQKNIPPPSMSRPPPLAAGQSGTSIHDAVVNPMMALQQDKQHQHATAIVNNMTAVPHVKNYGLVAASKPLPTSQVLP